MSQKAEKFYEQKWLLVHFGFVPWKQYLAEAKLRMFQAENHCKVICFHIALNTHDQNKIFPVHILIGNRLLIFQMYLVRLYFRKWIQGMKISMEETKKKTSLALATYENSLMSKTFHQWINVSTKCYIFKFYSTHTYFSFICIARNIENVFHYIHLYNSRSALL